MSVKNLVWFALILTFLTHPALGQGPETQPSDKTLRDFKPVDFNRDIYYKNKLEFSLETGWLPNNIPFVFDFLVNSKYTSWPLHYTLVPNIPLSPMAHRQHMGLEILPRGNTTLLSADPTLRFQEPQRRDTSLSTTVSGAILSRVIGGSCPTLMRGAVSGISTPRDLPGCYMLRGRIDIHSYDGQRSAISFQSSI